MTDIRHPARSLLDEIEQLDVIEAEQLQEGVAFHAFQFKSVEPMESMILSLTHGAPAAAEALNLPPGATVMDVEGGKIRVLFDPTQMSPEDLQAMLTAEIGDKIKNIKSGGTLTVTKI